MSMLLKFSSNDIEAIARIIGDTSYGASGSEITRLFEQIGIYDYDVNVTKWRRIDFRLTELQERQDSPNNIIKFIENYMEPSRYVSKLNLFKSRQELLNQFLYLKGLELQGNGKIKTTTTSASLSEAVARASSLNRKLYHRFVHSEVLKYCKEEYLQENYFHAVFEAVKGLLQRIREQSQLQLDGIKLITTVFDEKKPKLSFNKFSTDSEINELMGYRSLLVSLVKMVRNTHAHEPKLKWVTSEEDALDFLGMLSFAHRRLDNCHQTFL